MRIVSEFKRKKDAQALSIHKAFTELYVDGSKKCAIYDLLSEKYNLTQQGIQQNVVRGEKLSNKTKIL